jgi:SAM-dependent methyltransferase
MLRNARALNPEVEYHEGDMRSFQLNERYDSVIIADSIMYMLDEEDMLAAFKAAFGHLRPGGVFCTYIEELPGKFATETFTHPARKKGDIEITLIEHKWDPDREDTRFELLFIYLIREGRDVRVETDRHTCGMFPLTTWKRLLKEAGFRVTVFRPDASEIHNLLVCHKPL